MLVGLEARADRREVLVQHRDQREPAPRVAEGLIHGREEHLLLAHLRERLVHPTHHLHVGVVVQLDDGPEAQLAAVLGLDLLEEPEQFGLARAGQGHHDEIRKVPCHVVLQQ